MKRRLWLLAFMACGDAAPCPCRSTNDACVYVNGNAPPSCLPRCSTQSDCAAGKSCGCAGSCPGCLDCVSVCR